MKRELLVFIILLLCGQGADAQNMFNKGDKKLNLGIGIGSTLYTGSYYTNRIPPISASFEIGVKDELFDEKSSLGVGGYIGYTGAKWEEMGYGWKYSSIIIGGRGSLHYQLIENVDTYTGLMLGYNIVSSSSFGDSIWDDYSSVGSSMSYSWYIGGRYSFNDSFAAMAELGYGVAYLNLGITLSF
ncbi:MAG: hypothetical protein LC649_07370 [Bacteroidales bacterium]|nr:hypothetical protein [Bacteroidales bacterium]